MINNKENDYYEVAVQAREIANKIGHKIVREGYYSDDYLGQEYEYEGLRISYYNQGHSQIYIYINGKKALDYNFNTGEARYINGKWPDLIDAIYNQIPNILYKRKLAEEKYKRKVEELKSLEPYFKECVEYDEHEGFLSRLNNNMSDYDVKILKRKYRHSYRNNVTGDYDESAVETTMFEIYDGNTLVSKFNGNKFNIIPDVNYYAKSFIPGEWINTFKYFVNQTIEEEQEVIQNEVDSDAYEVLRMLKYYD